MSDQGAQLRCTFDMSVRKESQPTFLTFPARRMGRDGSGS